MIVLWRHFRNSELHLCDVADAGGGQARRRTGRTWTAGAVFACHLSRFGGTKSCHAESDLSARRGWPVLRPGPTTSK